MANNTLHLIIKDRDKGKIFDEEIASLSAINDTGKFDILPLHSHLISLIHNEIKITRTDNREEKMIIQSGVMKVIDNTVSIYLGIGK